MGQDLVDILHTYKNGMILLIPTSCYYIAGHALMPAFIKMERLLGQTVCFHELQSVQKVVPHLI